MFSVGSSCSIRAMMHPYAFSRSDRVALIGLKDEYLNGTNGEVLSYNPESERYGVMVGNRNLAVKAANLIANLNVAKPSTRICKFGEDCWRPRCHFKHKDEKTRAYKWACRWQSLSCCPKFDAGDACADVPPDFSCGAATDTSVVSLASLKSGIAEHGIRLSSSEQLLHALQVG